MTLSRLCSDRRLRGSRLEREQQQVGYQIAVLWRIRQCVQQLPERTDVIGREEAFAGAATYEQDRRWSPVRRPMGTVSVR